jgi:hypothetical protein
MYIAALIAFGICASVCLALLYAICWTDTFKSSLRSEVGEDIRWTAFEQTCFRAPAGGSRPTTLGLAQREARRTKVCSIACGIRSNVELNFGRYLSVRAGGPTINSKEGGPPASVVM